MEVVMILITNGLVHDAVNKTPFRADIIVEDGKIVKIVRTQATDPDRFERVIDASDYLVYPGFIDAHTHIGLDGYGIGYEGQDYNEMNDIISPQLRAIDGIQPMDPTFRMAAEAGITCVATGPGSANVLGGTFTSIKTIGRRVDDMVVKKEIAMKCAFGENPKRCYREKGNSSRMSTAAKLREALFKAREYQKKKEAAAGDITKQPAFDMKMEALLPVLRRELPLKAHAHQADDIFTALRIAHEFDVNITLEHVTEGHLIVEELVKENVPLAVGPSLGNASKFELRNKTWETPGILAAAGCQVSIITDSSVIPEHYLPLCAALAIKSGMEPFDALKAITINPAKHIGIADRVGSITEGKDADLVIIDGSPFEVAGEVKYVLIDGKVVVEK